MKKGRESSKPGKNRGRESCSNIFFPLTEPLLWHTIIRWCHISSSKSYLFIVNLSYVHLYLYQMTNTVKYLIACNPTSRYPEKHWNTEKNAVVWDQYFLIRHTPGITKIPIWKYFMCILARNFDISVLCTEKWHEFDRKRGIFSI